MFEENKVKVNTELTEHFNETETVKDKNGNDVFILKHIPYEQKQEFCRELAEMTLIADPDTGICYISALFEVVWNYLFIKYYTNIDVDGIKEIDDFRKLYDFCEMKGITFVRTTDSDLCDVERMWKTYSEAIIRQYEKRNSLEHQAKLMLSTDIDTNKAETRELIEKLIDMQGAMKEKEERDNVLDFGKAKKNTGVKTGGVKLNLGKKN